MGHRNTSDEGSERDRPAARADEATEPIDETTDSEADGTKLDFEFPDSSRADDGDGDQLPVPAGQGIDLTDPR